MLFLFQLRRLKREVQSQLDNLADEEQARVRRDSERPLRPWSSATGNGQGSEKKDKDSNGDGAAASRRHSSTSSEHTDDAYLQIPGIELKEKPDGSSYYAVSWSGPKDENNPQNWTTCRRLKTTALISAVALVVTAASASDSAVLDAIRKAFGVSKVTETLGGTCTYLLGLGVGSLLSSPLSEMFGRFPVYAVTLVLFGIWIMASALAPNIGAQIVFRFMAGLHGSAPMTVAGGSISDLWSAKEKTWAFPLYAASGFGSPTMGPVIASYIGVTGVLSWRWSEWLMLIMTGIVFVLVILFKEETLAPQLFKYKAGFFRELTGDDRFMSEAEANGGSIMDVAKTHFSRPFILGVEPIVLMFTAFMLVVYIVLFTYLTGFTYIFNDIYGINTGLTNLIFLSLATGIILQFILVPVVYKHTTMRMAEMEEKGGEAKIKPETRLLFAMYGAPLIPIGLFWQAWTDFPTISIWSPIVATAVIGFGMMTIYNSTYMYIVDAYETYAASALTFVSLVRYVGAGPMTVVAQPMYSNLGPRYTLTILACISVTTIPVPYILHRWGPHIREKSDYATSP